MVVTLHQARQQQTATPRVPPHNLQAEEALIGAALLRPEAANILAGVDPADFYKPAHGHIAAVVRALIDDGQAADLGIVAAHLERAQLLDAIGGAATLTDLQSHSPATSGAAKYAEMVVEAAGQRRVQAAALEIVDAIDRGLPVDGLIAQLDRVTADNDTHKTTGWERVDLGPWLDGDPPDDSPQIGLRTDGQPILYPGKIHAFNGEPECGKSMCAQAICAQQIAEGHDVIYFDFEDSPAGVVGRLVAQGCDIEDIREHFHYHHIGSTWTVEACRVMDAALAATAYTLGVLDGVTEAMMLCGQSPRDESEVAKFWSMLPRRVAGSGATALLIDHVVKDTDSRGRWAIGSEHKMAGIDGAAFTVEAVTPFGRNKTGMARLVITKDRPAWLRQHAEGGKVIAEFHVASLPDGTMKAELRPVAAGGGAFRPTVIMERISAQLANGPALTKTQLRAAIRTKAENVDLALRYLDTDGFIHGETQGRAVYYSNIKPYPRPGPDDAPPLEDRDAF